MRECECAPPRYELEGEGGHFHHPCFCVLGLATFISGMLSLSLSLSLLPPELLKSSLTTALGTGRKTSEKQLHPGTPKKKKKPKVTMRNRLATGQNQQ